MKVAYLMKRPPFQPFTCHGSGAWAIALEQAQMFLTEEQIAAGEARGKLVTRGAWQQPVTYSAIACSCDFNAPGRPLTVYGRRTLSKCRQSGYELEGRVSVGGKEYRGFTSSQLFELPDGRLVNVAVIHVCL